MKSVNLKKLGIPKNITYNDIIVLKNNLNDILINSILIQARSDRNKTIEDYTFFSSERSSSLIKSVANYNKFNGVAKLLDTYFIKKKIPHSKKQYDAQSNLAQLFQRSTKLTLFAKNLEDSLTENNPKKEEVLKFKEGVTNLANILNESRKEIEILEKLQTKYDSIPSNTKNPLKRYYKAWLEKEIKTQESILRQRNILV